MGSDSEDDERSTSKSPKNEESLTKENADNEENKTSTEAKEVTEKTPAGEPKKKRRRTKRSLSGSQKPVVDANSTNTAAEEAPETNSNSGNQKRRRKSKTLSESEPEEKIVDANSSNSAVEEVSEINSNSGNQKKRKRRSKTPPESQEPEEKAENSSLQTKKMPVSSENKMSVREDVEAKWKRAGIVDPKVRKPMFTDPALPLGWRRECIQRKTGKTEGLYDVYLFSPAGKKFRSRVELAKFLAATNSDLDPEDFDFSVYGRKGYALNSATKKKIKSILGMTSSVSTSEKKDGETGSVTPKPDKQSESGEAQRTYVKKGRKSKDKITPPQPQKKARFKFTPTIKEIFKCANQSPFCLDCGKTDCKYPYVVLEHPPRPLDLLVKEGIKYR